MCLIVQSVRRLSSIVAPSSLWPLMEKQYKYRMDGNFCISIYVICCH